MTSRPLVSDLDGTLIRSDLLLESLLCLLRQNPFYLFLLPFWLLQGRAAFKAAIAARAAPDMTVIPCHETVVDFLRAEKAKGRHLILATASHRSLAEALNAHLKLFDEVMASDGTVNLKSRHKAEALVGRFGVGGYDYIGNDHPDLAVWQQAHTVHVLHASQPFVEKAMQLGCERGEWFRTRKAGLLTMLKAMRVHQWVKNILVFVPLLASHRLTELPLLFNAVMAFLAFGFCASGIYLLNDMLDLDDDRHHRSKRHRPLASGALSIAAGFVLMPVLLLAALACCLLLPPAFLAVLTTYCALTLAYSFRLKRLLFVDVVVLAGLYTIRIVGGAAAMDMELSFWLAAFSVFVFLSLAIVKRYTELLAMRDAPKGTAIKGRGYRVEDLSILLSLGTASGYLSVLVMALYINSERVTGLYRHPVILWMLCPVMLYWISRIWIITHRGEMHDDPIVFAIKDSVSRYTAACMGLILLLAAL